MLEKASIYVKMLHVDVFCSAAGGSGKHRQEVLNTTIS